MSADARCTCDAIYDKESACLCDVNNPIARFAFGPTAAGPYEDSAKDGEHRNKADESRNDDAGATVKQVGEERGRCDGHSNANAHPKHPHLHTGPEVVVITLVR